MFGHLSPPMVLSLCLLAAGCSGGSGGGATNQQVSPNVDPGIIDPSTLPVTGTARYDGFISLNLPTSTGRADYTGSLGLDVDFGANDSQVTGQANQFRAPNQEDLSGRIIITDGALDRGADVTSDFSFEAGLSGTLSGTDFRNIVVTGTMVGDFEGPGAETVSGRAFGDVVTPIGIDIFDGSFATTRN